MDALRRRFAGSRTTALLAGLGVFWAGGVVAGFYALWDYSRTPGAAAQSHQLWPAGSRLSRAAGQTSLVVFAHPRCPCTRATLAELQYILPAARGRVTTHVVFLRPEGKGDNWVETDLWRTVGAMPGVLRVIDHDGTEAERFGSRTSGQTLVYGREGRLIFSGGITLARGHQGENEGRNRIISLLTTGRAAGDTTNVYGCGLQSPGKAAGAI